MNYNKDFKQENLSLAKMDIDIVNFPTKTVLHTSAYEFHPF